MAEEVKKSEIKEFHLKFARALRAEPEVMELLQQISDDLTRMWLVLCLTDGMDTDEIISLNGMNISKIQIVRNEYLKKKYMQAEVLYETVKKLKKQVADELHESREIRKSIETGLEAAMQKQLKSQSELIASKDDMIGMLKKQIVELERNNEKMEELMNHKVEKWKIPEPKQGLKRFMAYKRKATDAKRFIEEFIKNDKMNDEQKEYLLQCLEEGVSVKEIETFASANLPVDIMRRLRRYYELRAQGTQR